MDIEQRRVEISGKKLGKIETEAKDKNMAMDTDIDLVINQRIDIVLT